MDRSYQTESACFRQLPEANQSLAPLVVRSEMACEVGVTTHFGHFILSAARPATMQYQLCSMSTEILSLSGCPAARGHRFAAHATQFSFWLRHICVCTQFTWIAAAVLSVVFCILWPVLTIPAGVFSKSYFYFFVIISIIWGLIAAVIAIFLPLWESRDVFARCAEVPSTQLHLLKYIRSIILISARQQVGGRPFSILWRSQCLAFPPLSSWRKHRKYSTPGMSRPVGWFGASYVCACKIRSSCIFLPASLVLCSESRSCMLLL